MRHFQLFVAEFMFLFYELLTTIKRKQKDNK